MSDWRITYPADNVFTADINDLADGDYITISGADNSNNGTYTITDWNTTSFTIRDPYAERMDDIERKLDKVMERLGVLDDPDPETLEKSKALKKAYDHYKMLEKLAGAKDD
jgi:hypothetical protein